MNETESTSTLSPQLLARAYDCFVSARWRGEDEAADPVALWFEAHWVVEPSLEPETPPATASVLGASGRGIHWYALGDHVFGYVPGHEEGCYRVAAGETMPPLKSPWDAAPAQERSLAESLTADRVLIHQPASTRPGAATKF